MSDEEDEFYEPFSASEDEWNPGLDKRDGESSDDDDSDFEESPKGRTTRSGRTSATSILKKNSKIGGVLKQQSASKKRKSIGPSLRAKLYNKYRPPPKTVPTATSGSCGTNSPSASTSKSQSKNYQTPNDDNDNSDTDGSVANYLVNPVDIDLRSSFFNKMRVSENTTEDVPNFDCNAGMVMSETDSEDNETSNEEGKKELEQQSQYPQQHHQQHQKNNNKTYNFLNLLENAKSLERCKEQMVEKYSNKEQQSLSETTNAIDVKTLLALGENIEGLPQNVEKGAEDVPRLIKTKSTRVKKHKKTRPTSTVGASDTDESDWEEIPGRKRF